MEDPNGAARLEAVSGRISSHRRTRATQRQFILCLLFFFWTVSRCGAAPIELMSAKALAPYSLPGASIDAPFRARLSESFGRLPLMFEATDGSGAEFLCRGSGYFLFLSPTEAVLKLQRPGEARPEMRDGRLKLRGRQFPATLPPSDAPGPAPLRIKLVGANAAARGKGLEPLATKVNYFLGNDPKQWRTSVPTFGRVRYQNVYPGIDLVYYGNQRQLEYDFVVEPGASPGQISLKFEGADKIGIDAEGNLILQTAGDPVHQRRPVVYQALNGGRKEVAGRYVFKGIGQREVGFEVAAYDRSQPLIIDPVLVYSTYVGGLNFDRAWDIAVDANRCVYVVGETASTNSPPASGGLYPTNGGGLSDVFLAKLGSAGTNLIYYTYLGGSGADSAYGIGLDGSGNVYLTGLTASVNFPVTTNAVSRKLNSLAYFGNYTNDAFVTKLDATGTNLLYSTYLGGSGPDEGIAITVDGSGNIYVSGDTLSADFPTNSISQRFGGVRDSFVIKLNPASTNLLYSTYLGGSGSDFAQGIAVDAQGEAVISGYTTSVDFPLTNAVQTNFGGGAFDAFVTKLNTNGWPPLFSTYLGGSGDDAGLRVVLDTLGNAYFTGLTTSTNFSVLTNFPSANVLYSTNAGSEDAFVMKLDASGTNVIYWTYLGGVFNDEGWSIAVDTNGNAYVIGLTSSTNFPTVNACQPTLGGFNDVFVLKLNSTGTALDYSTYLGGAGTDNGVGIALDGNGNAYIAGTTGSIDFPLHPTTNGLQTSYGGGTGDAFVAKLFPRNAELRAEMSGVSDVTILWPYGLPNFELQSTDGLAGTNTIWMTVTNAPTVVGDDNAATFSNPTGSMFFRLRRTQ